MVTHMEFKAVNSKGIKIYGGYFNNNNQSYMAITNADKVKLVRMDSVFNCGFYTDLNDIDNKRIYTNDLIKIEGDGSLSNTYGVVLFHEGNCIAYTDKGYILLNNDDYKYKTFGNALLPENKGCLSEKMKNILIEVVG